MTEAGRLSGSSALFAVIAVWIEYVHQRERERLRLAQEMIERLTTDEMLLFAVTTLDWGDGIIVVPEPWRDVVKAPSVIWNLDHIRDALKPKLTPETRDDPVRLLYRHAFVQLFNHLERMGELLLSGAIAVRDLRALTWLVKELKSWRYAQREEQGRFFLAAIESWYSNGVPMSLINKVAEEFPKDISVHIQ